MSNGQIFGGLVWLILIAVAWRKGWGAKALLPLAVAIIGSVCLFGVGGALRWGEETLVPFLAVVGLTGFAWIIYMAVTKPK